MVCNCAELKIRENLQLLIFGHSTDVIKNNNNNDNDSILYATNRKRHIKT